MVADNPQKIFIKKVKFKIKTYEHNSENLRIFWKYGWSTLFGISDAFKITKIIHILVPYR